jgi:hypothetical protein
MKVVTKYEVLETRELNEVEIFGLIALVNKTFADDARLMYQQTCLQPEYTFTIDEGEVNRIGMVNNRVVFEINLIDQETGIPTEEAVLYWADVVWGEFELTEIGG